MTEEDAEMSSVRMLVQTLYSMIEGLREDFFQKSGSSSELAITLLIPSSEETGNVYASYKYIMESFKEKIPPKKIRPSIVHRKKLPLVSFKRWFCDRDGDNHQNLMDPNENLPVAEKFDESALPPCLVLPDGLKHHCFLSYKQKSAIDMVGKQFYILSSRGYKCWYDQQYKGTLNLEAMQEGVAKSMVYILFLSKDIFPSTYIEEEVKTAIRLNKPIIFLHHPDTGSVGYWDFGDYISNAPSILKPYFTTVESIQLQRRYHLEEAVTQLLDHKLQDFYELLVKK